MNTSKNLFSTPALWRYLVKASQVSLTLALTLLIPLVKAELVRAGQRFQNPLSQDFTPSSVLISDPRLPLIDPEFDYVTKRLTFLDEDKVYVARLDANGFLIDPTGREILVDTGAIRTSDLFPIPLGNGPEWGRDQNGASIFYMREENVAGQFHPYIAGAYENSQSGDWSTIRLTNTLNGIFPIPTYEPSFSSTGLIFGLLNESQTPFRFDMIARDLGSQLQRVVPVMIPVHNGPARWVRGRPHISLAYQDSQGISQAGIYDPQAGQFVTTTNNRSKRIFFDEVWSFPSPEYNGAYLTIAVVNDLNSLGQITANRLEVFLEAPGGPTKINTIYSPSSLKGKKFILSPEPVVHEGKSFAVIQVAATPTQQDSAAEIWLAYLPPTTEAGLRLLSDPNQDWATRDPEPLTIGEDLYVYYSVTSYNPNTSKSLIPCQLWRANTGL